MSYKNSNSNDCHLTDVSSTDKFTDYSEDLNSIMKGDVKRLDPENIWTSCSTAGVDDLKCSTEKPSVMKNDICKILKIIKCLNKEIKILKSDKVDYRDLEDICEKLERYNLENYNESEVSKSRDGCVCGECSEDNYQSEKPSYDSEKPSYDSEKPSYDSEKPSYSSEKPSYDLDDKIKNYIDHQINYKCDEILSILDNRLSNMEKTIDNIKKLAVPSRR